MNKEIGVSLLSFNDRGLMDYNTVYASSFKYKGVSKLATVRTELNNNLANKLKPLREYGVRFQTIAHTEKDSIIVSVMIISNGYGVLSIDFNDCIKIIIID